MTVASKELSQELYELSGWDDESLDHHGDGVRYNLGYLLRKLPDWVKLFHYGKEGWQALSEEHITFNGVPQYRCRDGYDCECPDVESGYWDTPEDAVCKLAIELFRKKIITNNGER